MFDSFIPFTIQTSTSPPITINGIHSPSPTSSPSSNTPLPALLLLHGFPQTHHIWHLVAPQLLSQFAIVALDIRGYGASSKPSGVKNYAKSLMAKDCVDVMTELGHERFYICAHDRGARVAHKLLVDHPGKVRKAILLDICPTLAMYSQTSFEFARAYFHWFFLIQESPLPETGILADPKMWVETFMGGRYGGLEKFAKENLEIYIKGLGDAAGVHAMCEDYRAAATVDLDEARADLEAGRRIRCDLRVLWGKYGVIEKCFDALREWRQVVDEGARVSGEAVDCGHYLPEEAPDVVVRHIREFFVEAGK